MAVDCVGDEEILFRNISIAHHQCKRNADGTWHLSSQAFSDRSSKPSVDRALLCDANPLHTQKSENDGVVSVVAYDVRATASVIQNDAKGNLVQSHAIDVTPDPLHPHNPAHALITSAPEYANKSVFRKLLERLQFLAELRGWLIEPTDGK